MRDWAESAATTRSTPVRNLRVAETHADVRGRGGEETATGRATTKQSRAALPDEARRQRWKGIGSVHRPKRHERLIAAAAGGMWAGAGYKIVTKVL